MPSHSNLLIGVIELNDELGWKHRLRWWGNAPVEPDLFFRCLVLRPLRNEEYLSEEDLRVVAVV